MIQYWDDFRFVFLFCLFISFSLFFPYLSFKNELIYFLDGRWEKVSFEMATKKQNVSKCQNRKCSTHGGSCHGSDEAGWNPMKSNEGMSVSTTTAKRYLCWRFSFVSKRTTRLLRNVYCFQKKEKNVHESIDRISLTRNPSWKPDGSKLDNSFFEKKKLRKRNI